MSLGVRGKRPAFVSAKVSLSPHLSASLPPLLPTPQTLLLSDTTGTSCRRTRVRFFCVILFETIRIVSKLTHTTNVGEPCYPALGSASCCLRDRGRRHREHPGPLEGRGVGGAWAEPAHSACGPRPSLPPSPADRNDLEVQESHVTSPGG